MEYFQILNKVKHRYHIKSLHRHIPSYMIFLDEWHCLMLLINRCIRSCKAISVEL